MLFNKIFFRNASFVFKSILHALYVLIILIFLIAL